MSDHTDGWILVHEISNALEFSSLPPVIAIKKYDDLTPAFGDREIKCRGLAPIRFVKDANLRSKLGEEFRRAVRRTVVDDHNLPVTGGKILIQGACDGLFDEGFMVVGVYDYADKRSRHSAISMTRRV